MTKTFREKWLEAVEKNNSVLCAGLDPAEFAMGRGDKGLAKGVDKLTWSMKYLEAVAPYCAAVKANIQYWKRGGDSESISIITELAQDLGLIVKIDDSKLADIGSTNDAGLYHAKQKGFDAVTLAPFAGNMKEAAEQTKKWGIGLLSVCLMSNPEYVVKKNSWEEVGFDEGYNPKDIAFVYGTAHVRKHIKLANDAKRYNLEGLVIGAPSKKNHITEEEIAKVRSYSRDDTLALVTGVGAQGGELENIWKHFDKNKVIVNVGRAVMFPKGSNSTPEEQAEAAKHYQELLNELRNK